MRLPFLQVDADFLATGARDLSELLATSEAEAGWAMVRLWGWAVSKAATPDALGLLEGPDMQRLAERAAGWKGEPGAFLAALLNPALALAHREDSGAVRLLGMERYASTFRKMEADRARKAAGGRTDVARNSFGTLPEVARKTQTQTQTQTQKEEPLSAADATDAVKVLVTQAPLLPEAEAEKPKRTRKPPGKPTDSRHAPLVQALVDAHAEVKGPPYAFRGGRDARAVAECLALADQDPRTSGEAAPAEVVRRWRISLRWHGFPACTGLDALAANWNAYAKPQDASRPVDVTRGGVRAELFDHSRTGTVEDF